MDGQNVYFQMLIKKQAIVGDKIEIEGYASTDNLDFHNHVITTDVRTQEVIDDFMRNPALLLQHKQRVGSVKEITADNKGLYVKAIVELNLDNCFEKITMGHIAGFSVGIRLDDFSMQDNGGILPVLRIEKLRMFELSIVEIPANNEALFTFIKSMQKMKETIIKKMMDVVEDETNNDIIKKQADTATDETATDETATTTTDTTDDTATDDTATDSGGNTSDETSADSTDESAETVNELTAKIAQLESVVGTLQKEFATTNELIATKMANKEDVENMRDRISKIPTILAKSAQSQAIQQIKNTHKNINTFYKAQ